MAMKKLLRNKDLHKKSARKWRSMHYSSVIDGYSKTEVRRREAIIQSNEKCHQTVEID
jgi:hypothetical protein